MISIVKYDLWRKSAGCLVLLPLIHDPIPAWCCAAGRPTPCTSTYRRTTVLRACRELRNALRVSVISRSESLQACGIAAYV